MTVTFVRGLLIVVAKMIYFVDANSIAGNLCWSMPCMNGGSCFGSSYTYLCVCPINYSGALCERRLGICQESPCGNRGLCVETGLFSFECRCYFDYMGPLCEEHVPKNDVSVWSSLIPVHTRVLFDILQEAYRVKTHDKSEIDSNIPQVDFPGSLTTNDISSSFSVTPSTTTTKTTKLKSNSITDQSETTEAEHVIQANGIQLENIFPQITSTLSISDIHTQTSSTFEITQQDDYNNQTIFSTDRTSDTMTQNIPITLLPLTTVENMMTASMEQNQTNYLHTTEEQEFLNTTEQENIMNTLMPNQWSSYNSDIPKFDYTTETMQNLTVEISNNTESNEFVENTTSQMFNNTSSETTNYSSNPTDNTPLSSLEPTMTSILTPTDATLTADKSTDLFNISQSEHHQLLLKLCQQLLSQILPNVTSLSKATALEAALSLSSGSPLSHNNSAEALLTWIKQQLSSTPLPPALTTTTTATTATTPTTITTTMSSTVSSSVPSLLINEKKFPSISLQRVNIDDVLHQMNNNIDGEN